MEEQDTTVQTLPQAVECADGMPSIPAPAAQTDGGGDPAKAAERQAERQQAVAERKARAKKEMEEMQPWTGSQSILALDRIRRLLEHLDDAGSLFKSSLRRFLKVCPAYQAFAAREPALHPLPPQSPYSRYAFLTEFLPSTPALRYLAPLAHCSRFHN